MSKKIRIILIVFIIVFLAGGAVLYVRNRYFIKKTYTQYALVGQTDRADNRQAEYVRYADGFIRYSKDGIAYYNADNVPQWNSSYELQNPIVDIRNDYCAVAGTDSPYLYVFNREGQVAYIDTVLAIVNISVSAKGYVAVVLEDSDTQYIDMYDTAGEKVYHIKTSIQGNGVPTAIAISDDGAKLAVAYMTVEENHVKSSIAFYNFGEVGKNESERLVGGFEQYEDMYVPRLQFVDADTVVAFATGKISIYEIQQYPKLIADIETVSEIHGIFYSSEYIGVIYTKHNSPKPYEIYVYDKAGNIRCTYEIEQNFKEFAFVEDNLFMYDDYDMYLVGFDGNLRYKNTFDNAVDSIIPVSRDNVYVCITARKVQKILLE